MGLVHSLKEMKWDPGSVLDLRRKKLKSAGRREQVRTKLSVGLAACCAKSLQSCLTPSL